MTSSTELGRLRTESAANSSKQCWLCFVPKRRGQLVVAFLRGVLYVIGNVWKVFSRSFVRLTHVDTPYNWKDACGARAKLVRWDLGINTDIVILESLRKVPVHGKKPAIWKNLLMSWVVIRSNPKTSRISLIWTNFVFALAILFTKSDLKRKN